MSDRTTCPTSKSRFATCDEIDRWLVQVNWKPRKPIKGSVW